MTVNSLSPAIIGLNEFDSWCIDAVKPVSYFSPLLSVIKSVALDNHCFSARQFAAQFKIP